MQNKNTKILLMQNNNMKFITSYCGFIFTFRLLIIYNHTHEQKEIVQSHHPRRLRVILILILESEKPPSSTRNSPHNCSYVDQKFLQSYKATVGADFMEK